MSTDEPMKGFSTPAREVRGPIDLVARMNEATSEDWETVPLPARQQLGWHEDDERPAGGYELKDFTGKSPEELLHSEELSSSSPKASRNLVQSVTYHLEATPPPAEPAGAPGSKGYNELNRGVPAAEGFDFPGEFTLEEGANVRTFRLPEGEAAALPEGKQAEVDGVGPYAPNGYTTVNVDPRNVSDDTRQRVNQTPSVNDPYRNPDGSLKDPREVQDAAPAYPDSDFGAKDAVTTDAPPAEAAVDTTGAKADAPEGSDEQAELSDGGDDAGSDVPDGTVAEVLKWVGNDAAKARAALEVEQAKDSPRTSLVGQLNDKV